MSNHELEGRPKIYVTSRGARYVKADEVLRRSKVRKAIKKMAQLLVDKERSSASPENRK